MRRLLLPGLVITLIGAPAQAETFPSAEAVADSIRQVILACHPERDDERVQVSVLPSLANLDWDADQTVIGLAPPSRPCAVGRLTWSVRIQGGTRTLVKPVGVDVRREIWGLVLIRDIARGQEIGPGDVDERWIDVTYERAHLVRTRSELDAMSMKRVGRADQPLTDAMIAPTPVVWLGDKVLVYYRRSGFQIQMEGLAREDGRLGQSIRVRNVESGKTLTATVTGPGMLEVRSLAPDPGRDDSPPPGEE